MRPTSLVLLSVVLAVASCGKDRSPLKPKPAVIGDDIVFYGYGSDGIDHLYLLNVDGTGLYRLTNDSLDDREPRWSPDGTKIAFLHTYARNGDSSNVTVMNADGTNRIRLTHDYADACPSWSPDGTQIAYQHGPNGFTFDLWVVNADGTSPHLLISFDSLLGATELTWTSQGTFLGDDSFGLVKINADGTGYTRIRRLDSMSLAQPRLSPDGTTCVFSWGGPYGSDGPYIYTMNTDGSDLKQLTYGHDRNPVWSPDGNKVAYLDEAFTLWTMNVDGTNPAKEPIRHPSPGADYLGDWK